MPKGIFKHPSLSADHKRKIGEAHKGRLFTDEHRQKLSESHKNNPVKYWKGKKLSDEHKGKMRESHINNPNRKFKDTDIELKVETELRKRNINYQKQVPLCKIAIVDFYLPEYRIVIQCDGDYWHSFPSAKERDRKQDSVLIFNGFNVYRFWQHDINKSVTECIDIISKQFNH